MNQEPIIRVENLSIGYDGKVIMKDLSFTIPQGDIFIIMGGSGCGKSTLLRTLTGLIPAQAGQIFVRGTDFIQATPAQKLDIMQHSGILYQGGALFSSMTLAENVVLPLQQYTTYAQDKISQLVSFKLALVGLAGYEGYYPSEISGGMRKRAGLARAFGHAHQIQMAQGRCHNGCLKGFPQKLKPGAGHAAAHNPTLHQKGIHILPCNGNGISAVTHDVCSFPVFRMRRNTCASSSSALS